MQSFSIVGFTVLSLLLTNCATSHFSGEYNFASEPVESVSLEYFDIAISTKGEKGDLELAVEAAYSENSINFTTDEALLRVLKSDKSIQTANVRFAKKGNLVLVYKGRQLVGRLGRLSPEGLVMLNYGTFNVKLLNLEEKPSLILDEPVISILSQKDSRATGVTSLRLQGDRKLAIQTAQGDRKTLTFLQSILVRPEFEKSGLLSPHKAVLEKAGKFIYAKMPKSGEKVAVAHVLAGGKLKMLKAYKSKFVSLGTHNYLWVSPR